MKQGGEVAKWQGGNVTLPLRHSATLQLEFLWLR
jgi:hypothetical protein